MTVVERDGRIVIVDVGLMFPTAEHARHRPRPARTSRCCVSVPSDIEAIVLTHGHEDHVGALPYVLREVGNPPVIYGGLLTIGMVRSKLDEHKLRDVPLTELPAGDKVQAGPFEIELVHMSHSIPDMRAVALRTDDGDDPDHRRLQVRSDPGRRQPRRRLAARRARPRGRALPCAGTRPTPTGRESLPLSRASARRSSTSSAAARAASSSPPSPRTSTASSRRSTPPSRSTARSRWSAARCARTSTSPPTSGWRTSPPGVMIQPKEIEDFPDDKVVVISTGSQGEPLSALRRMAHNDHRDVSLHSKDTVIFSATPIPGNERAVNETVDHIFRIGASVVTAADAPIHASGHGWQEELKLMLNLTKPRIRDAVPRRPQAPAPARRARRVGGHRPRQHLHRAKRRGAGRRRHGGEASARTSTRA